MSAYAITSRLLLAAAVCCGLGVLGWTAAGADDKASPVPRYRLKVGQELTYRQSSEF